MSDLPDPQSATPARPWLAALSRQLRGRLAALGAVGAVMVALPVVQLLRYQNAEVQELLDERSGLDPVAGAVQVQRGLLAHRELASQVLHGQTSLEPERVLRQRDVNDRVAALSLALARGQWERAAREADSLREDWTLLAKQVQARSLSASSSDESHRLLLEQTLQVVDLVADVSTPQAGLGRGAEAALSVMHAMPRLAWQMGTLSANADATDPDGARHKLAASEAALARTLGRLDAALEHPLPAALPLVAAGAAAGAAADRYYALLRGGPRQLAETQGAANQALQAQWHLFDLARAYVANTLDDHVAAARQRRAALISTLAGLALVALLLWLQLWRGTLPPGPPAAPADGANAGARAERAVAGRLLDRLRENSKADSATPSAGVAQDVLPTWPPRQ